MCHGCGGATDYSVKISRKRLYQETFSFYSDLYLFTSEQCPSLLWQLRLCTYDVAGAGMELNTPIVMIIFKYICKSWENCFHFIDYVFINGVITRYLFLSTKSKEKFSRWFSCALQIFTVGRQLQVNQSTHEISKKRFRWCTRILHAGATWSSSSPASPNKKNRQLSQAKRDRPQHQHINSTHHSPAHVDGAA